jgi:Protein of unknown function (DUF3175)
MLERQAPMAPKKQVVQKKSPKSALTKRRVAARKSPRVTQRWSAHVAKTSDALDLKHHLFQSGDASEIARSLKRSAERSKRRKGTPYQSAMSMLNFYINRAGKNLPAKQLRTLDRAKDELRKVFGRAA